MYKITLFYQSNEPGIFTKEEETASDLNRANMKKNRMLNRWLQILCPHINFNDYWQQLGYLKLLKCLNASDSLEQCYEIKYDLIQQHLKKLNELNINQGDEKREFKIEVYEIENPLLTMMKQASKNFTPEELMNSSGFVLDLAKNEIVELIPDTK
jgi:hypothetical protein